jgi:hypothetical protein
MASGFSIYYANKVLDKAFGSTDFVRPPSMWVALFTDPSAVTHLRNNDLVSASEVSGGGYLRVEILGATGISFITAAGGQVSQNADVTFAPATGAWGTVYATALVDAATNGNVLVYDDWATPQVIAAPDAPRIPINNLIVSL